MEGVWDVESEEASPEQIVNRLRQTEVASAFGKWQTQSGGRSDHGVFCCEKG